MAEHQRQSAPQPRLAGARFLVVEARYYEAIGAFLLAGAAAAFEAAGASYERIAVPGALEIPASIAIALDAAAAAGRVYDGVVALGCVIRGDTPHFEYVAGECARGLNLVALETGVPVIFGVLTVETVDQALERAATTEANKGGESMDTALEMADLLARL